jgi:hypothetical protein
LFKICGPTGCLLIELASCANLIVSMLVAFHGLMVYGTHPSMEPSAHLEWPMPVIDRPSFTFIAPPGEEAWAVSVGLHDGGEATGHACSISHVDRSTFWPLIIEKDLPVPLIGKSDWLAGSMAHASIRGCLCAAVALHQEMHCVVYYQRIVGSNSCSEKRGQISR